uniref:HYDIN axonemal central pair apparatus protein n=1 Tax=Monodelphis domestica TaxID=13616 RepID=F6WJJ0_MONDO
MSLTTEERLSSTRVMCRPQITELLDMGETTHQKYSSIDLDQTLFQPFPSEIVFQNYAACEVYEVPLILRNNDKIPRLVKIVEESSPYFKVISPNDICNKVAPGVPSTFRILFTPEENKDYSHVLTCVTEREKFIVPIKARGARAILDFPDELNFGICPVKHKTEKVLLVRNIGNREAVFDIKVGSPFSAEPSVGTVNVGDTVQLSVDFEPLTLGDHSAKLIVNYDTGRRCLLSHHHSVCRHSWGGARERDNGDGLYSGQRAAQINTVAKQWRLCEDLIIEEEKRMEQLLQECILDPSLREHLSVISHAFQNQRQRIMSNDMLFFGNIFVVEPVEGEIWPNSAAQISVTFYPREAILYQQTIYCEITGRETRLPLRIKGEGMGPKVVFNFDTLDIGKAFVGSTHCYETILSNKGSIDALFNLDPPTTPLGSCFIFNPKEGIVEPSGVQAIQISFRSSILGHFREEFLFSVNGSPEPVKLTIRGCVIGPTFHFNVPALDFGDVSYGFPRSLTCSLNNTSLIPMTFKLRVPGDGVGNPSITSVEQISDIRRPSWSNEWSTVIKPREFTIKPSSGSIRSQGFVAIRVTLCSNTVKKYQLALVVDVEGIGEEVLALLITGRCVVPKLRVVNQELNYGYCFLKYPYQQTVQLVNDDDLPGCYGVPLQEYEETPSVLFSSLNPCGIINPHSTIELILVLETQVLGEYHCTVQITTFGSKDPPLLRSVGEGPVVNVYPDKIDFGSIYVLKETSRSLHLSNQSYITAFFSVNKKSLWKILPEEGIVPPETEIVLTVTANLDDMLLFKDVIILSIQNSNNYHIPVQALGKGTTIVSDKPFAPELNLGAHFSVDPFFYNLKLTNKGRRYHQLYWMNEGFRHCQKQTRTSISNEVPMHQNVSQVVESEGPVFQVHPVRMELGPGQSTELVLEGFSDSPKVVKERLVCYAIIGGNVRKTQIMTVNVNCEFIAPIIQLSTKQILYHLEKEAQSELEPEFKPLTLKNVSSLPVRVILSTREPFYLCDVDKSILFQPCGPMEMAVGEEKKLLVKFDPFMRNDLNQWVAEEVLAIKYLEHPQVDQMSLRGEVHFPNLTFETMELDFGCILNDTEVIRYIQMVNCSPLMVKFRWSFLVDNKENQIRKHSRSRFSGISGNTTFQLNESSTIHEDPIKSSFEEVDREVLSQSQVEFQDNLWVFEPDDSLAIGVEEVFDILPLYGVLPPLSSHQVSFSFYGHCDIIAQVKALCEVEGGPTYEITLKGEASLVNYTFDTKEIHYGLQVQALKKKFQNLKQILKVYYLPGVPEAFERNFQVQIAHLEPETITVTGEGIFPRICLDLPRNIKGILYLNLGKRSDCVLFFFLMLQLDVQLQMEIERLIIQNHALEQQKLFDLEDSFFSSRARRRLLKAQLPEYILDFGYIILGEILTHYVKITNTSNLPVSFQAEKGALHDTGFSVHLDRVKNLPFCESETCEVRCDPQAANVSVGSKEAILPIKVSGGPTLHICLRAKVTTPSLSLSHDKVEFGTIQCGQCQVVTIQLYNDLPVSCEWSIHNPRQVSKLDKRMPKYLRRKLLAELKPKRQAFDVLPVSGILHSGDRKNVQVKFMPSEEKFYSQCLTVNIAHSTQKLSLFVQGYGLEPRLDFSPSVLELGPLLPYAPGDEAEVIVKNPCDFPIEFYSLEFDQEYLLEEKILRNLKGYDACNTILLPPRAPGEKLPPEVHEYYKELVRFREEQKNKAGEFQIPDNGTWSSTKRISLSQGVSASSNMEERHGLDIRHYQEEEEEEDNLDRFFSHVGEKTQSASDSRSVEEVGEIDHNPVSRSIARHLGISTSPESHTANKHQRGIAIMVHGAPVSGKTAVANSLAKYYGAVCLTLDSIVLDALSDSNSVPGIRARELCMRATMEQSIRDGEESVKESSLAQTSIGLSRISNENLAKHTSEATLVSPETRNFTKGNRGSGQTNKTKSDSHGSGSQKQHHQMHQSETSGSQVPSSPLTYTPIQLRIMGSTSEGDMGFFSCVLPEDLFVQIIEERLQLSDCYRGVVFDGIESVFARNAVSSLQCLLRAINNREHIYFINLSQDYTVMKAREKAKQEQEEQERLETIAKEKARLQKMDEEEYDALTEEEKNMFDREVLEAMRERKKRKQEKLARELQEKRLQQELERQREEEEMKKKTKKKREPTKEELTGKKNMPKQSINAKGEVKSELWLDRKVSMVKDHLTEEKKEEKRRKSKQLLGETLPLQPLVEHEESEKDLLRESEKHVIHRFKIYEMNLKDIQQILMFWDRKQGVWVPHAGTEEIHHDTEDQRQAPTVRKGRKDREKERLEKLEKEKAERERLEKEKAEKERLEKLKTTEDRSDVLEVEEEDHEGKKEFGVPILEFQPSISEEFTCKQVLESERLPKIEQMVDILDVTVVELPIPPPALFSIIQFPAKRVPVITTEILKHFTFVVPPSEETSTTEEKKENESESDIFTGTLTPKEEQPTPSRRQRKDKDGGPVKEKRGRGTPITKKTPQVLPSGNITPLATLDESTFTTTQIQDKFVRLSNFRWIVPAHGEVTLRVHFSSNETGNFDQTFNFEILGTRRQYQLYCRGVCTYPSICRDPRVVFPHRKKDWKPDETVFKKYVINQDTFHFGPLLCGKSRDRYKAVQFPDNMEKLTILNNSPLTSEVTFLFQHDVKANTYILDPPFMILKPNEKQVLSVWAYPTAVGLFDDSIVCCIKENPEPAVFKITCQGIRPELELDHKQLHFEKLLLHRKESKIIFLKNVTPLPVAWRISSLEHLGDDFSVSKTQGVIYPGSEYCLQIHFQPTKAVNIKKAIRLEILDADYLIGVVQIENIQIFAESYDIALDITFPKGNEGFLDFGVVRVMEEVKQFLALKNKGKYEITYSFILEPLPANLPKVNSIISTQPKRGTLTTTERPTNIQVTFRSKREIRIDSKPILRCQIIEPNSLEGGEVIASIPIKFSVNAVFSKYAISPASVINFGALVCGSRKTSSFNIENQGVLDFKFSISRLNRDAPLLHGRKIGGHPKHARSKENVSFFRFSTTRTVKGNESLQKELSSMNQARFTLNMFTIYPGFGSIPPGGQQSITVDCIADPVGRCEEYLAIEISDRDPKDQPNGIQYTLIAEACFPAFVTDDVASIFEEHLICKNINQYQFLQAVESRGVFFEDENKFMFRNVLVGHQGKARFKINNVGKIPCDVSFSVKPTSVKSMFRISDIFEVEPNKMCISSHSQAFATVTFTPPTMQTFQCVFEASLDGLPNFLSKTRNLSFDIVGEGNLPRVMIIRPVLYNQKGNPLFLFKRLLVGQSEKLPLILKNNGTIPAQLLIDLRDSTQTFSLKGRPSTKYIYIIEENSPTEIAKKAHTASLIIYPGETGELDVQFQPDKPERMTGTIRLTVINNQYEETIFQMIGESYEDDITLDNIHGLVNSKSDMEEIIEFTDDKMMEEFLSASRMAHLQFGDCHIDQTYEVTFTMTNRSKKIVVKFEWAAMNSLQFSPQVGHLHAGCAKDIKVTLKSSSPTAFKKTLIKCKISRIKFQQPADQVSDWDDHMRTVKWVDAVRNPNTHLSSRCPFFVAGEAAQGPASQVAVALFSKRGNRGICERLLSQALCCNCRFDLINIGPVQLEYNWLLSPDEPTKAVSFADQESSNAPKVASKGSAIESASSHAYSGAYTYPFSMEPVSGVIPADKRQTFKVKFSPLEVGEFENNLCCQIPNLFPGDQNLILTVKGRSLLPFCHFDLKESDYISNHKRNPDLSGPRGGPLDPSTRVIEFDAMGVGAKNIQTFTITNPTSDTYSYRWTSEDIESLQNPPTFTCLTQGGTIHPEKKAEISFLFIPHTLDIIESFWTFSIPEHNISVPFLLVGKAIDPLLSLTPSYLTFSSILIGHEAREMAYIINNEDQDFSFAFEEGSCFSEGYINNLVVKPMQGIVPAKSRVPIEIFFTPKSQGQVNFNLICHVKRKAQFLTLNVKAEGYSTKVEIRCKESDGSVINLNPNGYNLKFNSINIKYPPSLQASAKDIGDGVNTLVDPAKLSPEGQPFHIWRASSGKLVTHGPTFVCVITGTAVTPAIQFSFYSFNFGTCFIYSPGMPLYQQMLVITNNEEKPISLDCLYTNTAQLEVSCGVDVIKPRNHLEVPITFYPREAIAYNEIIPFEINGLSKVNVEIQGKGTEMKVSVLDPENKIVKLGAILPKHMVKKYATIINNSLIPLTFNLTTTFSVPELTDPKILTLTPCTNITLKPQEVCKVEIVFSPMKRIPHFNEEVLLEFTGLLRSLFLLNGCCQALEINLDQDHIPFGAVVFQAQATRRLLMINTGDIGARFHWNVKKFAPNFSIQPDKGYITPGMEVAFEVTYHPTEIGKDSLYKNLPCSVQGRKPLLLTLSGACVNVAGIKEVMNFSCQVRSRHVQTIMLSNRTNRTWHLRPIFEGEHWEGPEYFVLEAHQQNRPYEITYRPLTMNVDGRKHLGTLFFPLPDGTGLFYVLQGTAEAPKAITNIFREVPSKTPYVELLPVENWLNKLQRFRATVDMIKPEKQDLSVTIKGLDYIDVLAGSKKDYKLNFFSYKEGLFSAKVTFRNEVTNEYMFYLLTFKVLSSGIIKTIELSTFVRQSTSASIKLENPLPYTITFNTDCRVPDISVPSQFSIPSNSEGTLTFEFQPLKVGETTGRLNLHQSDLGTFQYELSLKANPALPEKPIYFQTPLGSSQPLNAKFINYTRQKTEYSCKTDSLDFHVEKVVPAPAGGQSGTEVSVEIIFEPSQLGEVRGMLYLSSAIGGEYTFPLIGLAQYPKPQGPIQIKAGFSATIPFKNIFHHSMAFSFIVESPAFSVKNVETVRAKKVHNISVTFDGNPSGNKTPVTTKLIVSGLHATGNEAGIKWIYYLKGITL